MTTKKTPNFAKSAEELYKEFRKDVYPNRGEVHPHLSIEQIRRIRAAYAIACKDTYEHGMQTWLAKQFNVTPAVIRGVVTSPRWDWIDKLPDEGNKE